MDAAGRTQSKSQWRARVIGAIGLVVALIATLVAGASAASAAPASPSIDLAATATNGSGDVVLAWSAVSGATSYKVDVSADNFATNLQTFSTTSLRATPTVSLPAGTIWWRVAAVDSSGQSGWTVAMFDRTEAPGPGLLGPGIGSVETLDYPDEAPVLSWNPVPAAKDYTVEWSTNDLFPAGGTTSATTPATSYSILPLLARGSIWFWRVRANLTTTGLTTSWSSNGQFRIQWPDSKPSLQAPVDDPTGTTGVSDIQLRWNSVPGAENYRVYVATDPDFTAPVAGTPVTVLSTSFSPPRSWDNAAYYWKVTALDPAGNEGPPSETRQFTRAWAPTHATGLSALERDAAPRTLYPASGATLSLDDFRLEWSTVPRASVYEVWLTGETSNFFTDSNKILKCYTPHTSITSLSAWQPLSAGDRIRFLSSHVDSQRANARTACFGKLGQAATVWAPGATLRWRVRALDLAATDVGNHQNPGNVDASTRFIRSSWSDRDTLASPASVTVTADHTGASAGLLPSLAAPVHCADPSTCDALPDTPELVWTPAADATAGYWVQIALDPAFTNKVAEFHTYGARHRMDGGLIDNSANQAYYWRVLGCESFVSFTSKSCLQEGLGNVRAFRKLGAAPVNLAATPSQDQVAFSWGWDEDLRLDDSTRSRGGTRGYRLEVATDELFSPSLTVYATTVDQPFATTSLDLLQDGTYYWRVRAIDGSGNNLPWSVGVPFAKAATKATQIGALSRSTAPTLSWQSVAGSGSYQLEVYNGDNLSVGGTRVLNPTGLLNASFTPTTVLAPGTYSWRVRRVDAADNVLPWSVEPGFVTPIQKFTVTAPKVTLVTPVDGAGLAPADRLLTWSPVPGAVRYRVQVSTSSSFASTIESVDTVQTSYALSGLTYAAGVQYYWRVRPLNSGGSALSATDDIRRFTVSTAPATAALGASVAGTTITYSWTPPSANGSTLTGYVFRYRVAGTTRWTEIGRPADATSTVLTGLAPGTKYEAQVAAVNGLGIGSFSPVLAATTASLPGVPGAPRVTAGTQSLTVSWSAPTTGGSAITGYILRWAPAGGAASQATVTTTSAALSGLVAGTAYSVDVAAINAVGTTAFSAATQGTPTAPVTTTSTSTPPSVATLLTIGGAKPIVYGRTLTLVGALKTSAGVALASKSVVIQSRVFGATTWSTLVRVSTSSTGTWAASVEPTRNREYRAVFTGAAPNLASSSATAKVHVRSRVSRRLNDTKVRLGTRVAFSGTVFPSHRYRTIYLQRYQSGKWVSKKSTRTTSTSTYRFVWKTDSRKDYSWRIYVPGHADHAAGFSARIVLYVS